jgi:hypothetical protein
VRFACAASFLESDCNNHFDLVRRLVQGFLLRVHGFVFVSTSFRFGLSGRGSSSIERASISIGPVSISIEPASISIGPVSISIEPASISIGSAPISIGSSSISIGSASLLIGSSFISIGSASISTRPSSI